MQEEIFPPTMLIPSQWVAIPWVNTVSMFLIWITGHNPILQSWNQIDSIFWDCLILETTILMLHPLYRILETNQDRLEHMEQMRRQNLMDPMDPME